MNKFRCDTHTHTRLHNTDGARGAEVNQSPNVSPGPGHAFSRKNNIFFLPFFYLHLSFLSVGAQKDSSSSQERKREEKGLIIGYQANPSDRIRSAGKKRVENKSRIEEKTRRETSSSSLIVRRAERERSRCESLALSSSFTTPFVVSLPYKKSRVFFFFFCRSVSFWLRRARQVQDGYFGTCGDNWRGNAIRS